MAEKNVSINCIVAAAKDTQGRYVIGRNNQLPWRLSTDMKIFKSRTWGFPVIMGRKTFQSLRQPLPGRLNIILSQKTPLPAPTPFLQYATNPEQALNYAHNWGSKQVFILGGAAIFALYLPITDRIYFTRVCAPDIQGDIFLPSFEHTFRRVEKSAPYPRDTRNDFSFIIETYEPAVRI